MSYQLRISILYTGMQINNHTALSRAFAFFFIVFLPVDLFLANPRPSWRKSPFCSPWLPPPPFVMGVKRQTCSYVMVTSDWKVELKRRSNRRRCSRLTLSPRLCAKKVPPFWLRRFLRLETGAIFSPKQLFFHSLARHSREIFLLQSDSLICLPVNNNENSTPLLK